MLRLPFSCSRRLKKLLSLTEIFLLLFVHWSKNFSIDLHTIEEFNMKRLMLALACLLVSSASFARGSILSPKGTSCFSEGKAQTKIVGHTMCVNGKATKLPSYDNGSFNRPLYCFNNNFTGIGCAQYKPHGTSRPSHAAPAAAQKTLIDGTWYAVCTSGAQNPDGDSWGWENNASCKFL